MTKISLLDNIWLIYKCNSFLIYFVTFNKYPSIEGAYDTSQFKLIKIGIIYKLVFKYSIDELTNKTCVAYN